MRPGADPQPVIRHPHVAALETRRGIRSPGGRPAAPGAGRGAILGTPTAIRRGAAALGEHTDAVLAELGYTAEQIAGLRAEGEVASRRLTTARRMANPDRLAGSIQTSNG